PFSLASSRRKKHPLSTYSPSPSQLIVVNSSSSKQTYVSLPRNPILARAFGLFRQIAVIADSNSSARASGLEEVFLRALEDRGEEAGVVVSIEESPLAVCEEIEQLFAGRQSPAIDTVQVRAKSMLRVLSEYPMERTDWDGL